MNFKVNSDLSRKEWKWGRYVVFVSQSMWSQSTLYFNECFASVQLQLQECCADLFRHVFMCPCTYSLTLASFRVTFLISRLLFQWVFHRSPQQRRRRREEERLKESLSNPLPLLDRLLPVSGEMYLPCLLLGSGGTAAPSRLPFEVLFRFMTSSSEGLKVGPFLEGRKMLLVPLDASGFSDWQSSYIFFWARAVIKVPF